MKESLKGKSMLTLLDFSREEIEAILSYAHQLKEKKNQRIFERNLQNRNIALIFDRPSCRTRTSFVVAASDEGAHLEIFPEVDIRFGIKESVKDIARVLGRLFDGIAYRGEQDVLQELAEFAGVPVWNGLSNIYHPTQVLADLMTIQEAYHKTDGIKMAYIGDGRNNVATSLMIGSLKMGIDLRIVAPKTLQPPVNQYQWIQSKCAKMEHTEGHILVTDNVEEGLLGCDVIYGDVWVSMGEENIVDERINILKPYKVTQQLLNFTRKPETKYMHCLPALHNENTEMSKKYPDILEVSDDIFEMENSIVFDQAENRMHTIKSLMVLTIV